MTELTRPLPSFSQAWVLKLSDQRSARQLEMERSVMIRVPMWDRLLF
jgi:hypothetical protein